MASDAKSGSSIKSKPGSKIGPSSSRSAVESSTSKKKVVEGSIGISAADAKTASASASASKKDDGFLVRVQFSVPRLLFRQQIDNMNDLGNCKSSEGEDKNIVIQSKSITKTREKKVYSLPGQKFDVPEEREPLRIFYESLSKQIPSSEMAAFWLMEHGLLPPDRAKKVYERKQRKQKQLRTGTPVKSPPPPATKPKPEISKKPPATSKNGEVTVKKRPRSDSDDDDDHVPLSLRKRET